jgi:predicted nucleic acid-binding protein
VILVDTSIWIDHFHKSEPLLVEPLGQSGVLRHPMIVRELAPGRIGDRAVVLDALGRLPSVVVASHDEVLGFVGERKLVGNGLSLIDAHLLASVILSPGTSLWARDKRLRAAARQTGTEFMG